MKRGTGKVKKGLASKKNSSIMEIAGQGAEDSSQLIGLRMHVRDVPVARLLEPK